MPRINFRRIFLDVAVCLNVALMVLCVANVIYFHSPLFAIILIGAMNFFYALTVLITRKPSMNKDNK